MTPALDGLQAGDASLWTPFELDKKTIGLLDAVCPILAETELESEEQSRLAPVAVEALASAGLFKVSLPHELGGWEAEQLIEMEIAEVVARFSASACWNLTVGNFHSSLPAVFCSDEAVKEIFLGSTFPVVAGQPAPVSVGKSVPGGIVVSGRHSWGSGIPHCDWVIGGCTMEDGASPERRVWVAPKTDVHVLDNWNAFGLCASGSSDYVVEDLFIADGWWFAATDTGPLSTSTPLAIAEVKRGGIKYRNPVRGWAKPWHVGLVLGAAERAIETVAAMASHKRRRNSTSSLADREMFRNDLAASFVRISSIRDHAARLFSTVTALVHADKVVPVRLAHEINAMSVDAARSAVAVAQMAHSYAGGDSVRLDNPIQRILRDLLVGQQHIIYAETQVAPLGDLIIERYQ